jgi:hypothetical protein
MCKFHRTGFLSSDCPNTYSGSVGADWLPSELHRDTVEQLRERLRGYP